MRRHAPRSAERLEAASGFGFADFTVANDDDGSAWHVTIVRKDIILMLVSFLSLCVYVCVRLGVRNKRRET